MEPKDQDMQNSSQETKNNASPMTEVQQGREFPGSLCSDFSVSSHSAYQGCLIGRYDSPYHQPIFGRLKYPSPETVGHDADNQTKLPDPNHAPLPVSHV